MTSDPQSIVEIRKATASDAEGVVAIWGEIARERIYSAIDKPFTIEEERRYLRGLSPREATFLAVAGSGQVVGFQSLDLWSPTIHSMRHVGQLGTFLLPAWRSRGIGRQLFRATEAFARDAGYEKFVILVRASNGAAQAFYRALGFKECGRLARQVRIEGVEDDEILLELFL